MTNKTIREIESSSVSKTTGVYPLAEVLICPKRLDKVPDLATGGDRSRKYAIIMSLSAIPNLHEQPEPIMLQARMPSLIIDADSLDDLRVRCVEEIDGIIDQMKEALEAFKNEKANKATS